MTRRNENAIESFTLISLCQYRSRGDALGNQTFQISSSAHANVSINYEKTKEIILRISRGLWENMISSSAHTYFCINYEKEEGKLSLKSFTWSGEENGASLRGLFRLVTALI